MRLSSCSDSAFGRQSCSATFLLNVTTIGSFETSLGIAAGNTVEALIGAWLARRFANGGSAFDRASDVVKFVVLAGLTSTVIGAMFGVTSLCLGGFARWDDYFVLGATWSLGHLTSNLVIAPLLLVWTVTPLPRWHTRSAIDAVCLVAAGLGCWPDGFRSVGFKR